MHDFIIHYEDAPTEWTQVSASSHLAAAKDFALQSPRSGDCSIVVKSRNKSPEEREIYDRVGATYRQRAKIVRAPGQGMKYTAAGAKPSNPCEELRVVRLPLRRSALFLAVFVELSVFSQVVLFAVALILLDLLALAEGAGFARMLFDPYGGFASIFAPLIGGLVGLFPLMFLGSAVCVFLVNCALKLIGGLAVRVRR
jgi:hypothetical protein